MIAVAPQPLTTGLDAVAAALSDPTRRSILRLVRDDERSAGALALEFPMISRPAVSQHLKVLRDAGLVSVRSAGKRRMFRARAEGVAEMWSFIDEMWNDRLGRLKIVAEQAEWSQRQRDRLRPDPRPDIRPDIRPDTTQGNRP